MCPTKMTYLFACVRSVTFGVMTRPVESHRGTRRSARQLSHSARGAPPEAECWLAWSGFISRLPAAICPALLAAVLGVLALATPGGKLARGRRALGGRVVGDVASLEGRDMAASMALSLAAEAGIVVRLVDVTTLLLRWRD